jgi:hypothetical protein
VPNASSNYLTASLTWASLFKTEYKKQFLTQIF